MSSLSSPPLTSPSSSESWEPGAARKRRQPGKSGRAQKAARSGSVHSRKSTPKTRFASSQLALSVESEHTATTNKRKMVAGDPRLQAGPKQPPGTHQSLPAPRSPHFQIPSQPGVPPPCPPPFPPPPSNPPVNSPDGLSRAPKCWDIHSPGPRAQYRGPKRLAGKRSSETQQETSGRGTKAPRSPMHNSALPTTLSAANNQSPEEGEAPPTAAASSLMQPERTPGASPAAATPPGQLTEGSRAAGATATPQRRPDALSNALPPGLVHPAALAPQQRSDAKGASSSDAAISRKRSADKSGAIPAATSLQVRSENLNLPPPPGTINRRLSPEASNRETRTASASRDSGSSPRARGEVLPSQASRGPNKHPDPSKKATSPQAPDKALGNAPPVSKGPPVAGNPEIARIIATQKKVLILIREGPTDIREKTYIKEFVAATEQSLDKLEKKFRRSSQREASKFLSDAAASHYKDAYEDFEKRSAEYEAAKIRFQKADMEKKAMHQQYIELPSDGDSL